MLNIALACVLTVALECALFALAGWRASWQLVAVACVNIITNLTLNLCLSVWPALYVHIWALEATVVCVEFALYMWAFRPAIPAKAAKAANPSKTTKTVNMPATELDNPANVGRSNQPSGGATLKLFAVTLAANALSFGMGFLLF